MTHPDTPRERVSLLEEVRNAISVALGTIERDVRVDQLTVEEHGSLADAALTVLRKRGALSMDAFNEVRAMEKGK